MNGPAALQPSQILDWAAYAGVLLNDLERNLLLDMDKTFLSAWREENAKVQDAVSKKNSREKAYE